MAWEPDARMGRQILWGGKLLSAYLRKKLHDHEGEIVIYATRQRWTIRAEFVKGGELTRKKWTIVPGGGDVTIYLETVVIPWLERELGKT